MHIISGSSNSYTGPHAYEELIHRGLVKVTSQPIRTEYPGGLYRMFSKTRSQGLSVIPANKKKSSRAFLFSLHITARADNHLGLKHSSLHFLYPGSKGWNMTPAQNLKYAPPMTPIRMSNKFKTKQNKTKNYITPASAEDHLWLHYNPLWFGLFTLKPL